MRMTMRARTICPAHIRSALTQVSLSIPGGGAARLGLGTLASRSISSSIGADRMSARWSLHLIGE